MSTIFVAELDTSDGDVQQQITVGSSNLNVEAIRPHIYIHNMSSVTMRIHVLDANEKLIKISDTYTAGNSGNYFHGYIKFAISVALKASTSYIIRLTADSPYSFSESSYVGWVTDTYDRFITPTHSAPATALGMEIWVRKQLT